MRDTGRRRKSILSKSVLFGVVVREGIAIFARIVGKASVTERVSGRKF